MCQQIKCLLIFNDCYFKNGSAVEKDYIYEKIVLASFSLIRIIH